MSPTKTAPMRGWQRSVRAAIAAGVALREQDHSSSAIRIAWRQASSSGTRGWLMASNPPNATITACALSLTSSSLPLLASLESGQWERTSSGSFASVRAGGRTMLALNASHRRPRRGAAGSPVFRSTRRLLSSSWSSLAATNRSPAISGRPGARGAGRRARASTRRSRRPREAAPHGSAGNAFSPLGHRSEGLSGPDAVGRREALDARYPCVGRSAHRLLARAGSVGASGSQIDTLDRAQLRKEAQHASSSDSAPEHAHPGLETNPRHRSAARHITAVRSSDGGHSWRSQRWHSRTSAQHSDHACTSSRINDRSDGGHRQCWCSRTRCRCQESNASGESFAKAHSSAKG